MDEAKETQEIKNANAVETQTEEASTGSTGEINKESVKSDEKKDEKNVQEGGEASSSEHAQEIQGVQEKKEEPIDELLVKVKNSEMKIAEIESKLSAFESRLGQIESTIQNLNGTVKSATEYAGTILDQAFKDRFSSAAREIEKLNEKIEMLIDEVGAGEGLNVSKIPPTILEIVYQSTLDDVVNAIMHQLGYEEGERAIMETLEEIRERTSGSELFRFDGKRIRARDVAKSIERKLISAKQIQTTYDELLKHLLDRIPGYKPKNFRAMIKLKSQEYSVDASVRLAERLTQLEKCVANTVSFSDAANRRLLSLTETLNELKNTQEQITARIDLLNTKIDRHREQEATGLEDLKTRIESIEKQLGIVMPEEPEKTEEGTQEACEGGRREKEKLDINEDETFLYYSLEAEKEIGEVKSMLSLMFSEEKIDALIEGLLAKGLIEKTTHDGKEYLKRKEIVEQSQYEKAQVDLTEKLEERIMETMKDKFTFRKLQKSFPEVSKDALLAAIERLIDAGKIYVEGTERRKIYRISGPSETKENDGGV
ncbi:MAG: hypothetical protein ACPL1Y_05300 [Thermoplasmata archaeon]